MKAIDGGLSEIESIELRELSFSYTEKEQVLQKIQLKVNKGQTIALVGSTGSGKSTLVNLIARFYEPTGGKILINGEDYKERSLHWLRSNLGIVLQTPYLFRGSVQENIRYGKLEASDQEVEAVAKQVNAHHFISQLPKGYQTNVGESGKNLSTGERQLISLARALLANPQIVILDEATSSVDTETEQQIQAAIEQMLEGRIAFVIAHRLSTVRSADKIIVLSKGKILEQGTHQELLQKNGTYHRLHYKQFAEQESEKLLQEDSKDSRAA